MSVIGFFFCPHTIFCSNINIQTTKQMNKQTLLLAEVIANTIVFINFCFFSKVIQKFIYIWRCHMNVTGWVLTIFMKQTHRSQHWASILALEESGCRFLRHQLQECACVCVCACVWFGFECVEKNHQLCCLAGSMGAVCSVCLSGHNHLMLHALCQMNWTDITCIHVHIPVIFNVTEKVCSVRNVNWATDLWCYIWCWHIWSAPQCRRAVVFCYNTEFGY